MEFSKDNLGKNPLITTTSFHSQFMLSLKSYIDNNNFIRINNVETKDDRLLNNVNNYKYVDYTQNPPWTGPSGEWEFETSRDDGKTFKIEKQL